MSAEPKPVAVATLSIDSHGGYPLSSRKERIYSTGPAQADRFSILIYT